VEGVDLLSSIPSDPAQPSWNLAQAIAIYAYESRMAAQEPRAPAARRDADPGALAAVDRALAEATQAVGKPSARRRLFKPLARAMLSNREAALWTAFLHAVGTLIPKPKPKPKPVP